MAGNFKKLAFTPQPPNDTNIVIVDPDKAKAFPQWAVEDAENQDSPRITCHQNDVEITRRYKIPFSKFFEFRDYVLGYTFGDSEQDIVQDPLAPGGARIVNLGLIKRVIPMQEPTNPHLYGSSCNIVSNAGTVCRQRYLNAAQMNQYQQALANPAIAPPDFSLDFVSFGYDANNYLSQSVNDINATDDGVCTVEVIFTARDYIIRTDANAVIAAGVMNAGANPPRVNSEMTRWCAWSVKYAITALPLGRIAESAASNQAPLVFSDPTAPTAPSIFNARIPEPGVILLPLATYHVRWTDVPYVNWRAVEAGVGKVNANPFGGTNNFPIFPAQTLLCQAPEIQEPKRSIRGAWMWTITWHLDYRESGWNKVLAGNGIFYNAGFQAVVNPTVANGGINPDGTLVVNPVYKPFDFTFMFTPALPTQYEG
jgi:hypothetical protein